MTRKNEAHNFKTGQRAHRCAIAPSEATYAELSSAFDHLNSELFDGTLPSCLITLRQHKKARGYFSPGRFKRIGSDTRAHEIAMNSDLFEHRTTRETLSTLAHEMVHLWQEEFGKPSRGGYHNRQWADKMESVGLMPSTTGNIGGKKTGPSCTHYIMDGAAFDVACARFLGTGFGLSWGSLLVSDGDKKKTKSGTRAKFVCPECEAAAWGKNSLSLICGDCDARMKMIEPEESNR